MAQRPFPHGAHQTGLEWTAPGGALKALKGVVYDTPDAELRFRPSNPAGELPPPRTGVGLAVATDLGLFLGQAVVLRQDPASRELCLDVSGELTQLQRRQYFRIGVGLGDAPGRLLDASGAPPGYLPVRVSPRNLSGGGLCFESDRALERDARLTTELHLEEATPVVVTCGVLDCVVLDAHRGAWRVRSFFVGMPDRDRQRIVRYVQRQQLLLHRHRR